MTFRSVEVLLYGSVQRLFTWARVAKSWNDFKFGTYLRSNLFLGQSSLFHYNLMEMVISHHLFDLQIHIALAMSGMTLTHI